MDFGLARAGGDSISRPADVITTGPTRPLGDALTHHGSLVGTPAYMAPEQLAHEDSGPHADQFSFCVALWEALFGKRPFAGATIAELATNVIEGTMAPAPSSASVPRWLRRVVQRGLSREPVDRWPSMAALIDALSRDRARAQRRLGMLALAGVGVAGAGAVVWGEADARQRRAQCEAEGAAIEAVWNDRERDGLHRAIVDTGVPYAAATAERVMPWLDAHARDWAERRTEACTHARVDQRAGWDDDVLDRAAWCLDERRMELEALVAELQEGHAASVRGAVTAASNLRPLQPCVERDRLLRLPAPPPDGRAAVEDVRANVSRAHALKAMGQPHEGLEIAVAAVQGAEDLAWPPLVAAARAAHGALLDEAGLYAEAEVTLTQAYFEAAHAGAADVAAQVAEDLAYLVGFRLTRETEGLTWSKHAAVHEAVLPDPGRYTEGGHLSHMAAIHWAAGDYDEALAEFRRALPLWESVLGEDHPMLARMHNNVAVAQAALGAYDEAKASLERALALTERTLGPDHPSVAASLANLADVHRTEGDYARARDLHERALAMRKRALGPYHADVAASLNDLAIIHRVTGEPEQARALLERALAVREKVLGPKHPDVGRTLLNLGNVLSDAGEPAEAGALYERALAIQEEAFGPDHPDVAAVLVNLANARASTGLLEAGKALGERALAILEQAVGRDHPDVATVLYVLGDILSTGGEYEEARLRYARALEIYERALPPNHPDITSALVGLARVHLSQEQPADALPLAERAVAAIAAEQAEPLVQAEAEFVLARALWETGGDRARARASAERARDLLEKAGDASTTTGLADVQRWLTTHAAASPG
jgi:tetratricopeptide (TPR) repeat protein